MSKGLAARLAGFHGLDIVNLALTCNARGGPGIVLASVAFDAGIINAPFFTALVLTAVLTSQVCGAWLDFVLRQGMAAADRRRPGGTTPDGPRSSRPLRRTRPEEASVTASTIGEDMAVRRPPAHGGTLVDLRVDDGRAAVLAEAAQVLPAWELTRRQRCDLELLATGGFSPLRTFLGPADYRVGVRLDAPGER